MSYLVDLQKAGRHFKGVQALTELDLQLGEGEVLGLLGHNGAGKSTTMKLILGILAPSHGTVRVLGQDPRGPHASDLRLQLGYLPENVSFYDNLTGREVLRYFATLKRVSHQQADQLLERVGLGHAVNRRVRTYSKGMRQRLGLAQALLGKPRLLLLDEPTVGLDPMAVRDVYGMIDQLKADGTSVILCSHVLPGVEPHIDRVAILAQGRLLACGTIDGLRAEAGLPLNISARGEQLNGTLTQKLAAHDIVVKRDDNGQIEFQAPAKDKLAVLRTLLAEPGLQDVQVQAPSLDALYAWYDGQIQPGRGH